MYGCLPLFHCSAVDRDGHNASVLQSCHTCKSDHSSLSNQELSDGMGLSKGVPERLALSTLVTLPAAPVRTLTVRGSPLPSAMPATSLASFSGFLSKTAPRPRFVASARSRSDASVRSSICG